MTLSQTTVDVTPIAPEHIDGYHCALDTVARERRYLTLLEAFPAAANGRLRARPHGEG